MRLLLSLYVLVLFVGMRPALGVSPSVYPALETAFRAAKSQGKPVLINFYSTTCPTCQAMNRTVLHNPQVASEIARNWVMARINCSEDKGECAKVAGQYQVFAWPSFIFLDAHLNEARRMVKGNLKPDKVLSALYEVRSRP